MLICLDSFLHTLTILPLRMLQCLFRFVTRPHRPLRVCSRPADELDDCLRGLLIVLVSCAVGMFDASRLYHAVRGQSTLKLYVLFNVFEVMDKLLSSFGLDILDSFFSATVGDGGRSALRPLPHFLLAVVYVCTLSVGRVANFF